MDASDPDLSPDNGGMDGTLEEDPEKHEGQNVVSVTDGGKPDEVYNIINSETQHEISEEKQDIVVEPGANVITETTYDVELQQPDHISSAPAEHALDDGVKDETEAPNETHENEEALEKLGDGGATVNSKELNESQDKVVEVEVSASQIVESHEQNTKREDLDYEDSDPVYSASGTESIKVDGVPSSGSKVSSRSIPESNVEVSGSFENPIEDNEERSRLIEEYRKAVSEHRMAKEINLQLQTKLAEYFRRKKADAVEQQSATSSWGGSTVDAVDYEQRYNKYLASLSDLRRQFQEMQVSYQKQIEELKNICSQRQEEVDHAYSEFTNYKYSIGKKALNSRTGRPINPKDLAALFAAEQKKEAIVMQVRLDNIKLRNEVNKVEAILKAKEELADGLHLIDFEQLKIENQTYNEKIEERNEELSKLRRKISSTVQIMTHVKEKLQAIQQDNAHQKQRLSIADAELTFNRDQLTKLKQNRDRLRAENARLKRSSGLLGKNALLFNYEDSVDAVTSKKAALKETKELINQYQQQTFKLQKKIEGLQEPNSMY